VAEPLEPAPRPSGPRATAPIEIAIDPSVVELRAGVLSCPTARDRQHRSGDGLRFDAPLGAPCTLSFPGEPLTATVEPGRRYRVVRVDGHLAVLPE
jgi:hypothetical protein